MKDAPCMIFPLGTRGEKILFFLCVYGVENSCLSWSLRSRGEENCLLPCHSQGEDQKENPFLPLCLSLSLSQFFSFIHSEAVLSLSLSCSLSFSCLVSFTRGEGVDVCAGVSSSSLSEEAAEV